MGTLHVNGPGQELVVETALWGEAQHPDGRTVNILKLGMGR